MPLMSLAIRPATVQDAALLPAIHVASRAPFRAIGLGEVDALPVISQDAIHRAIQEGSALVATNDATVVGFALWESFDSDGSHLHQMSVLPDHGRQGIGGLLVETIAAGVASRAEPQISLITYADVPWNAPFYARHGFVPLSASEQPPHVRRLVQAEARSGIAIGRRTAMVRRFPDRNHG